MSGKAGMKSGKLTRLPKKQRPTTLKDFDARSAVYRELHGDFTQLVEQHGGIDDLTPTQRMLLESLVFANAWRRRLEEDALKSKQLNAMPYVALVDRIHSLSRTLGLKRVVRDTKTLQTIMAEDGK